MLSQQEIKNIFAKANAIITGDHFVYAKKETGWFHGSDYVNKDAIYPYTQHVNALCKELAFRSTGSGIQVVVGPTVGAVSLAQWTAHHYCQTCLAVCADEEDVLEEKEISLFDRAVDSVIDLQAFGRVRIGCNGTDGPFSKIVFTTKTGTRRVIKRGYDKHVKGARCLIVEDVINSGATVAKTRDAVIAAGGEVVGVGCLCNRSGGKVTAQTLCVPELFSLLDVDMKMFKEDECPICKERGPKSVRTDLGKGKEFLVRKGLA